MRNRSHQFMAPRRGHSLVLVVAVIVLSAAITVTATRTSLKQYQAVEQLERKSQADCLAESARLRAAHALAMSSDYSGETWEPTLPDPNLSAKVNISRERELLHVNVQYPANGPETSQVRVTRKYPVASLLRPGN